MSPDCGDTASALCMLDANVDLADSRGEPVTDVLVVSEASNPLPYKLFLSTTLSDAVVASTLARNPFAVIASQRTALLMVAFCQSVTQLLTPACNTTANVKLVFDLMHSVRMQCKTEAGGYWDSMINKLAQPLPGRFITEAPEDDVASVCKALAPLCCFHELVRMCTCVCINLFMFVTMYT